MKSATCLLALSFLAASAAFAQSSSSSSGTPHFAPVPPPPGMNDPGVNPAREPAVASTSAKPVSSPAELEPSHLPGKPIPVPHVAGVPDGRDANGEPPPDVSVHQEGENTIQEYRQNGRVYMVVVTPKHGPQQIYNVDTDGHMLDPNGQPPVKPVMYKIMQWGNSKPASASSSDDNGD
ncbi:DUF2782 domain-containing protein [Dyella monticola]|uniref:DUF2782 domain-containing protein n=1 Tax=Dyella monticola TaxID=1927958 RepID=A0A370WW44_9GAMM|nr:DUF2782 domain-containing protein [Dyella monticola]RDS80175.1 DUF2782 domain-containing protein [Dyella monticola]